MNSLRSERWILLGSGYAGLAFASRWAHHHSELQKKSSIVPRLTVVNASAQGDCTCELYRVLRDGKPQSFDIPKLLKNKSVDFKEARVFEINPKSKTLLLRSDHREEMRYDRLIIANGAPRLPENLTGLSSLLEDQSRLEPRIFHVRGNKQVSELRMALKRIGWMNRESQKESFVVIVGGGATGVEFAGEIASLRGAHPNKRVIVVESSYSPLKRTLGFAAHKLLREQMKYLKVEYFEGSKAYQIDQGHLYLENGQTIPWNLLVMAQGSLPDLQLFEKFGEVWTEEHQIRVSRDFQIEDWSGHYAIGDLAHYPWSDQKLPKTAQVASQQGIYLADRLASELLNQPLGSEIFRWQNWGYLVSLGPSFGAGKLGPYLLPVLWGPAVDLAKRAAKLRFDAQVSTGLKLSP